MLLKTYKYKTQEDLINEFNFSGYSIDGDLGTGIITDMLSENVIHYTFFNTVITNFPCDNDEWIAEYSKECYLHTSSNDTIRVSITNEVTDDERKYFNNYINRFSGEKII